MNDDPAEQDAVPAGKPAAQLMVSNWNDALPRPPQYGSSLPRLDLQYWSPTAANVGELQSGPTGAGILIHTEKKVEYTYFQGTPTFTPDMIRAMSGSDFTFTSQALPTGRDYEQRVHAEAARSLPQGTVRVTDVIKMGAALVLLFTLLCIAGNHLSGVIVIHPLIGVTLLFVGTGFLAMGFASEPKDQKTLH